MEDQNMTQVEEMGMPEADSKEMVRVRMEAGLLSADSEDKFPSQYLSGYTADPKKKVALFNMLNGICIPLREHLNETLNIRDIIWVDKVMESSEGTQTTKLILLIDENGTAYQTISRCIWQSLPSLLTIFGYPQWAEPLQITPYMEFVNGKNLLKIKVG